MQSFEGGIGIGGGVGEGVVRAVEKEGDDDEESREVVVQAEAMETLRSRTSSAFELSRAVALSLNKET